MRLLSGEKWTVRDGRGVAREYFDPVQTPPWQVKDDPELEADLAQMRSMVAKRRPRAKARRYFKLIMLGAALSIASSAIGLTFGSFNVSRAASMTIQVIVIAGLVWAYIRWVPFRSKTELVAMYLERHRCPSCAYKIGHAEAEGDGCVVCPECGAAWRMRDSEVRT
jgi:hypothetical protein